jgi:hypothetical protein
MTRWLVFLVAFANWGRSRASLQLEVAALRHQLAIYKDRSAGFWVCAPDATQPISKEMPHANRRTFRTPFAMECQLDSASWNLRRPDGVRL